jgi:hypothetical protein
VRIMSQRSKIRQKVTGGEFANQSLSMDPSAGEDVLN